MNKAVLLCGFVRYDTISASAAALSGDGWTACRA